MGRVNWKYGMSSFCTKEELEEHRKTKTAKEIAQIYNVSSITVAVAAKRWGLTKKHEHRKSETIPKSILEPIPDKVLPELFIKFEAIEEELLNWIIKLSVTEKRTVDNQIKWMLERIKNTPDLIL
jgi:Zn-dependent peptidase ImmA (M78 family)